MITITMTFGKLLISAPLLVLFAMTSTVTNAQTRIATAQTVKPDAERDESRQISPSCRS